MNEYVCDRCGKPLKNPDKLLCPICNSFMDGYREGRKDGERTGRYYAIYDCMENIIPTLDENGVDKDVVDECIRCFKEIEDQLKG